jgi:hypothetical protein
VSLRTSTGHSDDYLARATGLTPPDASPEARAQPNAFDDYDTGMPNQKP